MEGIFALGFRAPFAWDLMFTYSLVVATLVS